MSEYAERFIEHLRALGDSDAGAMAVLRRSLAFEPGRYPSAYPFVERYIGKEWHERDARRLASYAVAGLYALHSKHDGQLTFAGACGEARLQRVKSDKGGDGVERRFVSLLNADAENVVHYLRQMLTLMGPDAAGFDYVRLLDDLMKWMNPLPGRAEDRDRLRERWAREFARASVDEKTDMSANSKLPEER